MKGYFKSFMDLSLYRDSRHLVHYKAKLYISKLLRGNITRVQFRSTPQGMNFLCTQFPLPIYVFLTPSPTPKFQNTSPYTKQHTPSKQQYHTQVQRTLTPCNSYWATITHKQLINQTPSLLIKHKTWYLTKRERKKLNKFTDKVNPTCNSLFASCIYILNKNYYLAKSVINIWKKRRNSPSWLVHTTHTHIKGNNYCSFD